MEGLNHKILGLILAKIEKHLLIFTPSHNSYKFKSYRIRRYLHIHRKWVFVVGAPAISF